MYKGVGVFAFLILSIFFQYPMKMNLISLRPNYCIFIEYLKTGGGGGEVALSEPPEPPLDQPLSHLVLIKMTANLEKTQRTTYHKNITPHTVGEAMNLQQQKLRWKQ